MGIYPEIKLLEPRNGAFIPGCVVSGTIKFTLDEEMVLDNITMSLLGKGYVSITDETARRLDKGTSTYREFEDYVNIEKVIDNSEKDMTLCIGLHKTSFSFQLPQNIPASLEYNNRSIFHSVRSKIAYYICIKFERQGFKGFTKKFEKEFTVLSGIEPKLSSEPIIHSEQRKVFQLFGGKNNIVNVRATINNSIIRIGGQVEFNYEIFNDTALCVKSIETKIVEVYTFKCKQRGNVEICSDIADTDTKTGAIKSGDIKKDSVIINVPSDRTSLEFSQIVARDYFVYITANVPFPHRNVVLKVPIQIGDEISAMRVKHINSTDPPPSYWEAMGIDNNNKKKMMEN